MEKEQGLGGSEFGGDVEANPRSTYQKKLILLGDNDRSSSRPRSGISLASWLTISAFGAITLALATFTVTRSQFRLGGSNLFATTTAATSLSSSANEEAVAVNAQGSSSKSSRGSVYSESFQAELDNIDSFIQDSGELDDLTSVGDDEDEDLVIKEDENFEESQDTTTAKPNIILVLSDDLGYANIGDEDAEFDFAVPFLSKLAQKGIVMSNYYTQESCTPARAALLTGRYPLSIGLQLSSINAYQSRGLSDQETLLPQVLKSEGYTTYMMGKWNLGHFHPKYLPNARGFDYFLAFMDGQSYYWSKKNPMQPKFVDLMYGDPTCYAGYDGSDRHDYSTFLYRDKAVKAIENHDYESSPMFMYLAFQAVHDPFNDFQQFESGIPKHYLSTKMYTKVLSKVKGRKQRQYVMALTLMDDAVESIHDALDSVGQLENTYIIFSSDNGGCYSAGGKNGNYRGTKGSLWEGGTKVDAFLYSKGLIAKKYAGTTYNGLMHVTDWFPTVLDMAGVSYTANDGYSLDGVSQWGHFLTSTGDESARDYMLYNYIGNIEGAEHTFDILSNAPVAVRNKEGFKLIHAFVGNPSSQYYVYDDVNDDDGMLHDSAGCTQSDSMDQSGNYTYMLYDLNVDPYETTNLYSLDSYSVLKNQLYAQIITYYSNSASCQADAQFKVNKNQKSVWLDAGGYIVPWVDLSEDELTEQGYPSICSDSYEASSSPFTPYHGEHTPAGQGDDEAYTRSPTDTPLNPSTDDPTAAPSAEEIDTSQSESEGPTPEPSTEPSTEPTHKPSRSPTVSPSERPSEQPSKKPTKQPSVAPSDAADPTHKPTFHPTVTGYTHRPTHSPDYIKPTNHPTVTGYTHRPTHEPSLKPTHEPSEGPTVEPTDAPEEEM